MIKRIFLLGVGLISLGLAIIGIILPLIPTTPLLLLAATCFIRSSDRLYKWLITHKYLGPYIKNYREGKGIPLTAKIVSVMLLWTSILFTIFFDIPLIAVKILLAGTAAYFTWFIFKQKTLAN
ncbi:YbaN family protein [Ornithinibacillus sp. 179-J 7C1 HS]|uniref:YbaN family protein n=1 Tax=Ornithinibacillus sp. 179-J 7C1 HS TaxID=3142384 RepID=UPI0039A0F42C